MPSITNWQAVGSILAAAIVAYAVVIAQNVLFSVFLAAIVYLGAWLIGRVSGSPLDDMSQERAVATGVLIVAVLGYSILVVANVLFGVVVAVTVVGVSWLTSPAGPVAAWLDDRT